MIILSSPTKQMACIDYDILPTTTPLFLEQQQQIKKVLCSMLPNELQKLWACNDKILSENLLRLDPTLHPPSLSPALFSYVGLQFKHIEACILSNAELLFLANHLRILSAMYGVLKPFDAVSPYRLEMQAPLRIDNYKNLYEYWGDSIASSLQKEGTWILNLASKEYSKAVLPYLVKDTLCITCRFLIPKGDKFIEQSTWCKMARGQMIGWLAKHEITAPDKVKDFDCLDFKFDKEQSTDTTYVFIKTN